MKRALLLLVLIGCQGDPRLGVTSQAVFAPDPASYDFESVEVGSSAVQQLTITTDDDGDDLSLDWSCSEFSFVVPDQPVHIAPDAPLIFDVTFAPTSAGSFACDIAITGNGGAQTVSFTGTGTVPGSVATVVSPASLALDFGEIPTTITSSAQQIEVRNDGTSPLTLDAGTLLGGVSAFGFGIASGTSPVDPGSSMIWDVTCAPSGDGAIADTLRITSDDPNNASIDVALACTGITTNVYVQPAPAVFGEVLIGGSVQLALDIHNDGTGVETVQTIAFDTAGPGTFTNDDLDPGMNVQPGTPKTFHVTFTPDSDGEVTSTLTIGMSSGETINVGLTGSGATGILIVTPPEPVIELGPACVGVESAHRDLAIRNAGTGEFSVTSMDTTAPFSANATATDLPPGGVVELPVDVWFVPTAAGELDGDLNIHTSIPTDPVHALPLHGRGIDAELGATHVAFDFGAVGVDALSGSEPLGVVNCSASAVTISVALTGDDAEAFQILAGTPTDEVEVAIGATQTWSTVFRPTHQGPHVATFTITSAAGTLEIPLSGNGIVDLVPDDVPGTYLACSSGGAGAAWPVLLALLLLRRRSRRV